MFSLFLLPEMYWSVFPDGTLAVNNTRNEINFLSKTSCNFLGTLIRASDAICRHELHVCTYNHLFYHYVSDYKMVCVEQFQ